jgi:hypothetical protein
VYAQVIHSFRSSRFFAKGWGDLSLLNPDKFHRLIMKLEEQPAMRIDWQPVQNGVHRGNVFQLFEGTFRSPGTLGVPNLPESCKQGRVWLMRPAGMEGQAGMKACVIQLAATGEHRQEYASSLLLILTRPAHFAFSTVYGSNTLLQAAFLVATAAMLRSLQHMVHAGGVLF